MTATQRLVEYAAAPAAAILYLTATVGLYPFTEVFSFDPDEGINAIKASLLDRGFALYASVWDDQPPLFTHLLRGWFDLVGWDVNRGRLLVLLFAAAIVFALYEIARMEAGHAAGMITVVLLASSAYFARLSVSLMLGLPSLAFAVLALWALFRWLHVGGNGWVVAAGALMGCSLATKLFTAFLVPIIALWIAWVCQRPGRTVSRRPAALWLLCAISVAASLLALLVGRSQLSALYEVHAIGRRVPALQHFGPGGLVLTGLAEWPLTLLAFGAYALLLRQGRRSRLILVGWTIAAVVVLLQHAPVWYHHQLLLSVIHCAGSGIVIAELFRDASALAVTRRQLAWLRGAAAVLIACALGWSAWARHPQPPRSINQAAGAAVTAMRQWQSATHVVFSPLPMYAFRAGYVVPPHLAVLSLKRVATDEHLRHRIDETFALQPPDQVVLAAGIPQQLAGWIEHAMAARYRRVFAGPPPERVEVYVRGDLMSTAADSERGIGRAGP